MAVFSCKVYGAPLDVESGQATAKCAYCGVVQIVPKISSSERENLYDRASKLRLNAEKIVLRK